LLSTIGPDHALSQIVAGSLIQSFGAGILYIPLATLAFSSLPPEIRTDATGLYSLLRQLAYASGVALMTAVLQSKIISSLGTMAPAALSAYGQASLQAYCSCFRAMALVSILVIPGIFMFRLPDRRRTGLSA
jgi:DHA2 family multidrug resistance protein